MTNQATDLELNVAPGSSAPTRGAPSPVGVVLSFRDEADLQAYFALELPPPPGTRSSFGPMCERLENARNPKTTELPTAGAAWTEIIECRFRQASSTGDAEDAYIAYVDARRRVTRVHAALSRLSAHDEAVLRAHYVGDASALEPLTPTAERVNRECASRDRHETVDASLETVRREAKDMRAPKESRDAARAKLTAIRREATEMLRRARTSYAGARREPR